MTTAMARLPCKQSSSPSQQTRVNNFGSSRNPYWDMQQIRHPAPSYVRNHHRHTDYTGKRIELLQETKAFYVKSETVLDRKQELKNSGHLQVSQLSAPGAPPPRLLRKCTGNSCPMQPTSPSQLQPTPMTPPCCWASCHEQDRLDGILSPQQTLPPALPPKSPRLVPVPQRRTISGPPSGTGGELQTKLRRLLNTDSKENMFFPDSPPQSTAQSNGVPTREEKFRYSPGSLSPGCRDDDRILHCAPQDVRFKFGRSNSHSHTSGRSGRKSNSSPSVENTICHKSLPDLHTSTRRRASLSPRASTKLPAKPSAHHQATNTSNCPDYETSSDYSDHSFKRDAVCYRSEVDDQLMDCWAHIRRDSGASTQHSTEKDRSRKGSYIGGTPPSVVRHYSPESESSNSQTDYSPTCNSRFSDGWKEGRGRPILRSKSDISDRYWRQDNGRSSKVSSRPPRSMTQLENFFDRLGLDSDNYQRITEPDSKTSSPVFFDSVSSVDSALGLYSWVGTNQTNQGSQWQNNCSIGMGNDECNQRVNDPPSIVERNARIIKWLCQCRKVQLGYS
ncbi:hypothetical protein ALC60_11043 [Trachymyrmex zeteki]|uniref:Centrosome-associated FAM110 C-terminal domain-containing protein n=1 Tax=Mycetomoellerius zeteki TaxID=64791 RepID=A0A151WPY6_9HYME|nr:hypothetical protein ALC60_11043 [Trachymyrmex zeteki]